MSLIHYVCPQCTAVNRLESTRLADAPNCGKCHKSLITGYLVDLNNTNFDKFITHTNSPKNQPQQASQDRKSVV